MRLIHTSDWHLGQTLHEFDRSYEHAAFLDWLLALIDAERPDALLIAGDIFDNANPSAAAQLQFARFLTEARRRAPRLAIVVVAGNHDSPGRLDATSPFLALFDAVVVGQLPRRADQSIDVERLVVPLADAGGGIGAWCLAVPFLRPSDVPRVEGDGDPYLAGVAELYRRALDAALARRRPGQAIVALGHCHMAAGRLSEQSERRIVVGGAEALPATVFGPEVAYAALGHLHLAQRVGGCEHIRYSGSPLPMSFAEIDYPHQVVVVDFDGERAAAIRAVPVPRSVELLRVPASHAPVDEVLALLEGLALPPGPPPEAQPYLEVRVRLDAPEPGLRARVERALGDRPVRLARIDPIGTRSADDAPAPALSLGELERLAPQAIFARLCAQKIGGEPAERDALVGALMRAFVELESDPQQEPA